MTAEPPPIRVGGPAPPARRCSDCGTRLPPDARFCPSCGTSFGMVATRPAELRVTTTVGAGFRFGIGFFIAAAVFATAWTLVSLVLFGAFLGALTSGLSGLTSTGAQRFDGTGDQTSTPFRLSGSTEVSWQATPTGAEGCRHRAALSKADRPISSEVVVDATLTAAESGTYTAVGLPAADYVLGVASTCKWSFRLSAKAP
jgi:hypothetical protein